MHTDIISKDFEVKDTMVTTQCAEREAFNCFNNFLRLVLLGLHLLRKK